MQTEPVNPDILRQTVVAVPPLARAVDGNLDPEQNRRIVEYLEVGGIRALLYGGNANFYHLPIGDYHACLEMLQALAGPETLVIPSVGPTYATLREQAQQLRDFAFPCAMVLPLAEITSSAGVATGIRHFVESYGKPAVLYIKKDGYIDVADVQRLVADKVVTLIKYAIVRDNPAEDEVLRQLVAAVDPKMIMSGIGEQPAICHMRDFALGGFTSGCVCVAPRRSQRMLAALVAADYETAEQIRQQFEPLENLRNATSPIRVLHAAVELAGIAHTGPLLPLLSNVPESMHPTIQQAALALKELNS